MLVYFHSSSFLSGKPSVSKCFKASFLKSCKATSEELFKWFSNFLNSLIIFSLKLFFSSVVFAINTFLLSFMR
ncbi:MAG: hypothetical protein ISS16_02520 [Ignavibacteria bacterium]|nr:hypothetical protein [Ignavibacteria bacterium]